MNSKELIVVAGPNGAGKSTFVASSLSERPRPYLCADLIAIEFQHLDPGSQQIAAGREFLRRIEERLLEGEEFIVESTLSGRTLRQFLARAQAAGFDITIVFVVWIPRRRVSRGSRSVSAAVATMFRRRISAAALPAVVQIFGTSTAKLPINGL